MPLLRFNPPWKGPPISRVPWSAGDRGRGLSLEDQALYNTFKSVSQKASELAMELRAYIKKMDPTELVVYSALEDLMDYGALGLEEASRLAFELARYLNTHDFSRVQEEYNESSFAE